MSAPDAARAAVRGTVTDRLIKSGNPQAEHMAQVATDMVFDAIDAASWQVGPKPPIPVEYGTCRVCRRPFVLTTAGRVRVHGRRSDPCDGSGGDPVQRLMAGRDYTLADAKAARELVPSRVAARSETP